MKQIMLMLVFLPACAIGCSRSVQSTQSNPDTTVARPDVLPKLEPQSQRVVQPTPQVAVAPTTTVPVPATDASSPVPSAAVGIVLGAPATLIAGKLNTLVEDPLLLNPPSQAVVALAYGGAALPVVRRWYDYDLQVTPDVPFDPNLKPETAVPAKSDPEGVIAIAEPGKGDPKPPTIPPQTGGFKGRSGATKEQPIPLNAEGVSETEKSIALALAWIAKQQKQDGSWEFDGTQKTEKAAATAMAVLSFMGAGETHINGKKYKATIDKGLKFIQSQQKASGQIGGGNTYTHALATIALCEAYGLTRDARFRANAQSAINFIVKAQGKDGGWRYAPNAEAGDTSVFGWQIQALRSAQLGGLNVPKVCFQNAEKYLTTVAKEDGAQYSYLANSPPTPTTSSIGLLGKLFLGVAPRNEVVSKGVKTIWEKSKPDRIINVYYLWYGTLLFHHMGGDHAKDWNDALTKALIDKQITDKTPNAKEADVGSWGPDTSHIGTSCGKFGTTCMAVLSLEVNYRHLPLMRRDWVAERLK